MPEESSFRLTEAVVVLLGDGTGLLSNRWWLLLLLPIVNKSNIFRRSGAGKCFSTNDWKTPLDNTCTQCESLTPGNSLNVGLRAGFSLTEGVPYEWTYLLTYLHDGCMIRISNCKMCKTPTTSVRHYYYILFIPTVVKILELLGIQPNKH